MKHTLYRLISCLLISLLTSCAAKFACDVDEGFGCKSLSEVYAIDEQVRPSIELDTQGEKTLVTTQEVPTLLRIHQPVKSDIGQPIFRTPRQLRIWISDWKTQMLYIPNHYIYTRVDDGEWILTDNTISSAPGDR